MKTSLGRQPVKRQHGGRVDASLLVALAGLLLVPAGALARLCPQIDGSLLLGGGLGLTVATYLVYRSDKHRSATGRRRIPEAALHALALAGGWPGAFVAQRVLRHKTAKISFQLVFWTIVLVHQYLALDSLLGWRLTARAAHFIVRQVT